MIKVGTKVKYKNGMCFSNGEKVATVANAKTKVEYETIVYFKEVNGWAHMGELQVVNSNKDQEVIEKLQEDIQVIINGKQEEIKKLEDDIKKLNYTYVTLGELND